MSELGDVLELVNGADASFRTFRGEFRFLERPELASRAMARSAEGGATRMRHVLGRGGAGLCLARGP